MLAGMDQNVFDSRVALPVVSLDRPYKRGDFHKVGPCAYNGYYFQNIFLFS
jgi:hypothetical protein